MAVAELDGHGEASVENDESMTEDSAKNSGAKVQTASAEIEPSDDKAPTDGLIALLEACPDSRLMLALPALLQALPEDAQDRCLIVLRESLCEEIEGGVFEGDETGVSAWRRALGQAPPAVPNTTQSSVKRPFRAMAAPFQLPTAKRPREAQDAISEPMSDAASSSTSVYVANVPYHATQQTIFAWFQSKCTEGELVDVRLLLDGGGNPKGAAILTYDKAEAATEALALNGQPGLEFRKLIVKPDTLSSTKGEGKERKGRLKGATKGTSKGGKGDADGAKGRADAKVGDPESDSRSVLVKNLAFNATEANIGELFAGCGEVAAVRIARDSRNGRSRGFAVVEFTVKAAVADALQRGGKLVRGRAVRIEALGDTADAAEKEPSGDGENAAREKQEAATVDVDESGTKAADKPEASTSGQHPGVVTANMSGTADSIREHAQKLVAQAQAQNEDAKQVDEASQKQGRPEKPSMSDEAKREFPGGEEGFKAAVELASSHDSAEALLEAHDAEALKGRLAALGLKAGGSPLERAKRFMRLRDISSLEEVPKDLLGKKKKESAPPPDKTDAPRKLEPIKFVKAGEGD